MTKRKNNKFKNDFKKIALFLNKKEYTWILVSSILSIVLLSQWFYGNVHLATAEEGIPFNDSLRTFTLYKSLWLELGFGYASPFYLPRLILYGWAALLQFMGANSLLIQSSIFFFLLLTPLLVIPRLVKLLAPGGKTLAGYLAALFYLFNLFTLSQIFERFIDALMFLWAYLPLFLFFWIKWLDQKKMRYIIGLILSSFIYADAFGLTSSFLVLSTVAISYLLYKVIFEPKKLITTAYGIGGFLVWSLFQTWWILPIWMLRNDTFGGFINSGNSLASLKAVSQYFPTSQIILLKQGYFFGEKNLFYHFYSHYQVEALSICIFVFVLIGVITTVKDIKWKFLFPLFILGWFVCKGYNPPFGDVFFQFLFNTFPITQILRNPYEKFGVVFLLPYSIFFSFGLLWIAERLKPAKMVFIGIAAVLFLGYLVWPLWNGTVYDSIRIKVPEYYKEANTYLNTTNGYRILQLPLLQEATIQYTWGYRGEEASEFLFDRSSLSRSDFGSPTDEFYLHFPDYLANKNFSNILAVSGIGGIVVHKDTFQNHFNQQSIDDYEREIRTWKNISKVKSFDMLDVYTLPRVNDRIYSVNKVKLVNSLKDGMNMMVEDGFDPQSTGIVIKSQNKNIPPLPKVMERPEILYKKSSATSYSVHIKNAKKPFVLILSNSYNPFWEARADRNLVSDHFKINGFANGWLIKKTGDYNVDVTFHKNLL